MKNILVALLLTSLCSISAQNKGPGVIDRNENVFASFESDKSDLGRAREIKRTGKIIDGYKHIWKDWNNTGVVEATNGKKYRVKNINVNAKNNWVEVNVHSDSVYAFNRKNVNKVIIDNREFVNVDFPEMKRSFLVELIAAGKDFMLLKKYDVEIESGSPNPMRGPSNDKYKINDDYYIKKGESVERFKLKKSNILKLYNENADDIAAFAKAERLSFKDNKELAEIIKYANGL